MSTPRPEDVSEAVVTPGVAASETSRDTDALAPDDTNAVDGTSTDAQTTEASAKLNRDASSAQSVVRKVREDSTISLSTDLSKKLSENLNS
ncbi:hypothetical protein S7335_3760 [Synechococcus sp. PCC 7335]|uniref:hypothetical protein n=1 Tax=Synechococcus sp. (strain ATCC 29403 / PCC 7335) TaxID=91464 RepID=UPI00017EC389|nr:hypothetical protein [Synechococcus sp. PCC 7335]EDX86057.1 hypothetical protein S7335_3760 [Synechococcus sp. PCC 7335]